MIFFVTIQNKFVSLHQQNNKKHTTMKTQINTLVHGSNNVAGTNSAIRKEIADKIIAENHDGMKVSLFDELVFLKANWSNSGKSVDYFGHVCLRNTIRRICDINGWDYAEQTIHDMQMRLATASLHINGDMTCELLIYHRRNERCSWKLSKTLRVNECDIIIL